MYLEKPIERNRIKHWFVASDGHLHDTRKPDWASVPFRQDYEKHFQTIDTTGQLKASLRAGGFCWPGGYPLFFITSDGAGLCFDCVRKELRSVLDSVKTRTNDGWQAVAVAVNWEDTTLLCAHCNQHIASAYGEEKPTVNEG